MQHVPSLEPLQVDLTEAQLQQPAPTAAGPLLLAASRTHAAVPAARAPMLLARNTSHKTCAFPAVIADIVDNTHTLETA